MTSPVLQLTWCSPEASSRSWARAGTWLVAMSLVTTAACAPEPRTPPAGVLTRQVIDLRQRTAQLERELELAGSKDFYLLLDPAAGTLRLMLRGAELQRFNVLGLQVGHSRTLWISRRSPMSWQGVIWSKGTLVPPRPTDRIVIEGEAPGKGETEPEPPPIPPTAEELYRVPARFHIRFDGGLAIEIRPREADASAGRMAWLRTWWVTRWGDVAAALGFSGHDAVRLRVVLAPKDAESLYRSLPPSVSLLVATAAPSREPGSLEAASTTGR